MATLAKDVFKSKPFTFLVGEARTPFVIHKDAVSKQSHALDVLVNGSMIEAQDGTAVLEDVLEHTFDRFCQFIYYGDYETPEHTIEPKLESSSPPYPCIPLPDCGEVEHHKGWGGIGESWNSPVVMAAEPVEDLVDEVFSQSKKSKAMSKSRKLRGKFENKSFEVEGLVHKFLKRCQIRSNKKPTEDYSPVLLGHAQLYVFADKWGIKRLKSLSLYKLHQTLLTFQLYESRRNDIIKLARYAYLEDSTPDTSNVMDPLRELIVLYVVREVQSLNKASEFKLFLEENSIFGRDLVPGMIERLE